LASVIGHFVVGASLALPFTASKAVTRDVRSSGLLVSAGILAAVPDLDTVFYGVIPYGHFFGHRGFFHSPFFAIVLSIVLTRLIFGISRHGSLKAWLAVFSVFCLAGISHALLDSMTDAGLGVMLLYPWSKQRIFLPWRPLYAPPIDWKHLSLRQIRLMVNSELPLLAFAVTSLGLRTVLGRLYSRKHWKNNAVKDRMP
jgi:inner membrane protein